MSEAGVDGAVQPELSARCVAGELVRTNMAFVNKLTNVC